MADDFILEMRGITKTFPGVTALDDVTFNVARGEIHALVGENGAGKSTLMKILSGVYSFGSYGGDIRIDGRPVHFATVKDSERAGVAIIYQELTLVKTMNICENLFLGDEPAQHGIIDWNRSWLEASRILGEVGLEHLNPATKILNVGVGIQQLVEIAKALVKKTALLILDEPTAALSAEEAENLLNILRGLRAKGVTCIFISHRLGEVLSIADRVTVLRDGKAISTVDVRGLTEERMIALMVGRELRELFPWRPHARDDRPILEVRNWTVRDPESRRTVIDDVSFDAYRGEVLGIAGLVGAGRTEFVMSLFRVFGQVTSGTVKLEDRFLHIRNPHDAIAAGISLLSEDRKRYGLVLMMDIRTNLTLAGLKYVSRHGLIDRNEEILVGRRYTEELGIRTPSIEQKARNLSGGNQQKVVIGKWLMTRPKVLILDEPTRGIDVGAKVEIYNIINDLVEQGVCVVMISSELSEVLGMSDRILVMAEGRIAGELTRQEATQEKIMRLATEGRSPSTR